MGSAKYCVILTTTDCEETAILIAKTLTENKLAACVQMDRVESFFVYEAKNERQKEFRLLIKARSDSYQAIEESILSKHNYQLPQIIMLDVAAGLPEYLNWIDGK